MTQTQELNIGGAILTITATIDHARIIISMLLDLGALDAGEPDHSRHNLINYVRPLVGAQWGTGPKFWWCTLQREQITCKTGSQARRIIAAARIKLDDVISGALLDRDRRKAEMSQVFAV